MNLAASSTSPIEPPPIEPVEMSGARSSHLSQFVRQFDPYHSLTRPPSTCQCLSSRTFSSMRRSCVTSSSAPS